MGTIPSKFKKSYSPSKASGRTMETDSSHANSASSSSQPSPSTPNAEEYIEQVVCKEEDLKENEMKVVSIGDDDGKVLLVKQGGTISAIGHKCTHYGAPLEKGALGDGRVRCQWHGACFNVKTGDIEDFPGLDSLPCYQVTIKNGNVSVKADKASLKSGKRIKSHAVNDTNDESVYVIVGGGPAGANCVETLRQSGYTGRLVFVMGEPYLPYDRIKLSKALDVDVNKITLRDEDFYKKRNIELLRGVQVTGIDSQKKKLTLSNSTDLKYDKVFLATGSSPRKIPAPGYELQNVCVLRTVDDANQMSKLVTSESNVVILGASFIGLEAASILVAKAKSVTVVAIEAIPFEIILGAPVGQLIRSLFEEKGVKFYLQQGIAEYLGEGSLSSVKLNDGTELPADLCLIGVGVVPNTTYLASAGVELLPNRTLKVDEYLSTSMDGVYAGGDIVTAPVLGMEASIGHWGLANYHGHVAAENMMGMKKKLNAVPFFWTMLFGKGFRYCGFAPKFARVEIRGELNLYTFIAFYVMDTEKVGAILTIGRDPIAAQFGERLHRGEELLASDIDDWLAKF